MSDDARQLLEQIHRSTTRPWTLMEVCGGQTHALLRHGIDQLLPPEITLEDIYAGSAPFMVVLLVALALIIFVPQISLFLPTLLFG
jgi:hydrogenase expression/formation protein HypD